MWREPLAVHGDRVPTSCSGRVTGLCAPDANRGKNPFVAYAVVNDGAQPGQRTGDGAFVPMQLDAPYAAVPSGAIDYADNPGSPAFTQIHARLSAALCVSI